MVNTDYNFKFEREALSFDDVLLIPAKSEVLPADCDVTSRLAGDIFLKTPVIAAAMDTVCETEMAIAMACEGGIGIIHKNMSIEKQSEMIAAVKAYDYKSREYIDLDMVSVDKDGKLLVGAAIGVTKDALERATSAKNAGANVFCLDSAHGHSMGIANVVKILKAEYPEMPVIGGNIATGEGAEFLIQAGVDAVKVGMGPGSICTTRVVSGMGVPQISAIYDAACVAAKYDIPIIADGGIKYSGEISKAMAAGASTVMLGSMLGGCKESPSEMIEKDGKKFKYYRGMGSIGAMDQANGSGDRYFQAKNKKLVPEGIEAYVPYKGEVGDLLYQMMGGLKSGMGYVGCGTIKEMQERARFNRITGAGLIESHPHDVAMIKDSPNY